MNLAQAVNQSALPSVNNGGFAGFSGNTIILAVVVLAVVLIAYLFLSSAGRDRYYGTKGGRVRKRVTEYEDDDDIVEEERI